MRLEFILSGWFYVAPEKELRRCWIDGIAPRSLRRTNSGAVATGSAWVMHPERGGEWDFVALVPWRIVNRDRTAFEIANATLHFDRNILEVTLRPNTMFPPLRLPYIAERFMGITIPEDGVMYACSYEGLHTIFLEDPVRFETDAKRREDYDFLRSKGHALGLFDGDPILEDERTRISCSFDPRADQQRIEVRQGPRSETIAFATFSGDWFVATLSRCGRFLVLAEPYLIEVRRLD